jgi:hypothetical protein
MNVTLDIAAVLGAIMWPAVLLAVLLAWRKNLPGLVTHLARRVTKLGFAGISLELAQAEPFVPEWSGSPQALDLRRTATAVQVSDSTAKTFLDQLMQPGTADFAEVNLGAGEEWLTSRLFIMAIVFARMKGIEAFVFVETSGGTRRRYIGWAEPEKIRWALARRYPWLEQAYADAYSEIISLPGASIVSNEGRVESRSPPPGPAPSIELLREFLQRIEAPLPMPTDPADWVLLGPATNTYEHARWISSEELEQILTDDCYTSTIRSSELRSKNTSEQLRSFLSVSGRFVAVVGDDQRFEYLVDRDVLLEQVAKRVSSDTGGRS